MSFKDLLNENRWLTNDYAHGEALYQIAYEFERQQDRIEALERRIDQLEGHDLDTAIRVSKLERKLNHKGVEQ